MRPLVFAATLIDGYKSAETLLTSRESLDQSVEVVSSQWGPELRLRSQGREPLTFTPYFATGGRQDGAWRLTWMQCLGRVGMTAEFVMFEHRVEWLPVWGSVGETEREGTLIFEPSERPPH